VKEERYAPHRISGASVEISAWRFADSHLFPAPGKDEDICVAVDVDTDVDVDVDVVVDVKVDVMWMWMWFLCQLWRGEKTHTHIDSPGCHFGINFPSCCLAIFTTPLFSIDLPPPRLQLRPPHSFSSAPASSYKMLSPFGSRPIRHTYCPLGQQDDKPKPSMASPRNPPSLPSTLLLFRIWSETDRSVIRSVSNFQVRDPVRVKFPFKNGERVPTRRHSLRP
jgi:hypothetical protein